VYCAGVIFGKFGCTPECKCKKNTLHCNDCYPPDAFEKWVLPEIYTKSKKYILYISKCGFVGVHDEN
jgi:hypothetical protein